MICGEIAHLLPARTNMGYFSKKSEKQTFFPFFGKCLCHEIETHGAGPKSLILNQMGEIFAIISSVICIHCDGYGPSRGKCEPRFLLKLLMNQKYQCALLCQCTADPHSITALVGLTSTSHFDALKWNVQYALLVVVKI